MHPPKDEAQRVPAQPAMAKPEQALNDLLTIAIAGKKELSLLAALANRHGLVTGATGTGKTVTLQRMTEQFSAAGVPVFMADVKGDLSGLGAPGEPSGKLSETLSRLGISNWQPCANPVVLWDVFGKEGHPIRATVADMGAVLLGRLLNLNNTQGGVLQLIFKVATDEDWLLLDLKDLRAVVQHIGENHKQYTNEYGNVSSLSIGAIQRGLLTLESEGAESFFGEPMFDIADLMQTAKSGALKGRGVINILSADKLINSSPKLYSTFLLWMLTRLYEQLPEVGDLARPKLVFFFDEAHLLFSEASDPLLEMVERVVRLIRSKGVGVYFVTQSPADVPDRVLGQLSNRVQHCLRAFTPRDQRAVKVAADTLRANPRFDAETVISELGVGEALVSFLDEHGSPNVVERGRIIPPFSRIGPLNAQERRQIIRQSAVYGHYEKDIDRQSAYEDLNDIEAPDAQQDPQVHYSAAIKADDEITTTESAPVSVQEEGGAKSGGLGRQIVRGLLGAILGKR